MVFDDIMIEDSDALLFGAMYRSWFIGASSASPFASWIEMRVMSQWNERALEIE